MVLSCACLGPRHSPYSYYLCCASDIAAVGTTFNVFSYDAVLPEHRTHHLPNAKQIRYVLCHGRGLLCLTKTHFRRADCNYVGLKNGGATCYINSVMQQLYAVPGVSEQLLAVNLDTVDEDSAFFQLQVILKRGHSLTLFVLDAYGLEGSAEIVLFF